jgi:hypothetical protein
LEPWTTENDIAAMKAGLHEIEKNVAEDCVEGTADEEGEVGEKFADKEGLSHWGIGKSDERFVNVSDGRLLNGFTKSRIERGNGGVGQEVEDEDVLSSGLRELGRPLVTDR